MKILLACEESQTVTKLMRANGHECYSCDIQECSGGHPEWHIKDDCLKIINGCCTFNTQDGETHNIDGRWDLIIAHPPCTYLTNVATRHHSLKCTSLEKINARTVKRIEAMKFFMMFALANCEHIAIENPVGVMGTSYRKPDQVINPYQFAESVEDKANYVTKSTCLWLKGLDPLPVNDLPRPDNKQLYGTFPSGKSKTWEDSGVKRNSVERSKTFSGIAKAMAKTWAPPQK